MGLISGLLGIGRGIAGFFGGGTAVARVGGAVGSVGSRVAAGARALAPTIGAGFAGGAAFEAGLAGVGAVFGGDGDMGAFAVSGASMGAASIEAGGSPTALAGGRVLITMPNGDFQIFTREGKAVRPSQLIPAGMRLPGGAIVVSSRQGGKLIGITRRRRRRQFAAEAKRVRTVLNVCHQIEAAAHHKPRKRS